MNQPDGAFHAVVVNTVARLLDTLDTLEFIGRHMHPPALASVTATLGDGDVALRAALGPFIAAPWPEPLQPLRDAIATSAEATLRACEDLRQAATAPDGLRRAYRALRQVSRALERLYPAAATLPSVSRCFLEPERREDAALLQRLTVGAQRSDVRTGVLHMANDTDERGGFSLYIPEDYDPARAYPLIMALHGGAGHGRLFLWNWLREARSRGAILVAPTAMGDTWSLMEPALDSDHLARILDHVGQAWHLDRTRLLLTGMSDGGTFTLLSGLGDESPFTHLAPVAASFHPLLLAMTEPKRVTGLPIYLVHGALDWMFPISVARTAQHALTAAGADLTYREVADLSHTYPRDETGRMLDWFLHERPTG